MLPFQSTLCHLARMIWAVWVPLPLCVLTVEWPLWRLERVVLFAAIVFSVDSGGGREEPSLVSSFLWPEDFCALD